LAEISQTCDRLLVIQAGEIVAQGTEEEIASTLGTPGEIEVALRGPVGTALDVARKIPGVLDAQISESAAHETVLKIRAREDCRPEIARALVMAGHQLLRLDRGAARLESIFLELTHREKLS
jgi:ABC-2 type transport system ATP-binding protein